MPNTHEEFPDGNEGIIKTKEDVKDLIDKSKNSQELYENALNVLKNMESEFKNVLFDDIYKDDKEKWKLINNSSFDDYLDIDNPLTLFEKKWKELVERAKSIQENLHVQNLGAQVIESEELNSWISDSEKNKLIEELWQTRTEAIENINDDMADWFLDNENNISRKDLLDFWKLEWNDLFQRKEMDNKTFEERVNKLNLTWLAFNTFNIEKWSSAFGYCYWKLKEKLWNKNLFDFIDEQNNPWDQCSDVLRYSAFKMLFQRKMSKELFKWIDGYSWNKGDLIKYVKDNIEKDEDFKISFLTSIKDLEDSEYFWEIAKDLKEKDPNVKKAYYATLNVDIDVFKDKKVNGLVVYDDEWHWWWSDFFDRDFSDYKKKGFNMILKEDKKWYIKYVLKKGNDKLTMIKIKKLKLNSMDDDAVQNVLNTIIGQEDYNLFALRWHCHNTQQVINALWSMNSVWEWDLLIDGWCNNAMWSRDYYKSWIKGQICAYTSQGRWACTKAFVDKIIEYKNSWKSFSDLLWYHNWLTKDSGNDGYFAFNTERPDSVWAQYKKLRQGFSEEALLNQGYSNSDGELDKPEL